MGWRQRRDERADQGVAEDLALGHEQEVGGQQGEERGHVGVGGVVRGQHQRAAAGEPLQALGLETAADEAQARARGERATGRRRSGGSGRSTTRSHVGKEQQRQGDGEPRRVERARPRARARARQLAGSRGGGEPHLLPEGRARRAAEAPPARYRSSSPRGGPSRWRSSAPRPAARGSTWSGGTSTASATRSVTAPVEPFPRGVARRRGSRPPPPGPRCRAPRSGRRRRRRTRAGSPRPRPRPPRSPGARGCGRP